MIETQVIDAKCLKTQLNLTLISVHINLVRHLENDSIQTT